MNENKKKDLRNADPEQLAGLLKDLLDLNDPALSDPTTQNRPSKDSPSPSEALETDGE